MATVTFDATTFPGTFATIQDAIAAAQATSPSVLQIDANSFGGTIDLVTHNGGAPITFTGELDIVGINGPGAIDAAGVGGNMIEVQAGATDVSIDNLVLTGADTAGIRIDDPATAATIDILNTTVDGAVGDGVAMNLSNDDAVVTLDNVSLTGNGAQGVDIFPGAGANAQVTIVDSEITGNGAEGVNQGHGGDGLTLTVDATQITGNGNEGIDLSGAGTNATVDVQNGANISGNGDDGIKLDNGGAGATLNVSAAFINGNTGNGIQVTSNAAGTEVTVDSGTVINANTAGGLVQDGAAGANTDSITVLDSSFTGNSGAGDVIVAGYTNDLTMTNVGIVGTGGGFAGLSLTGGGGVAGTVDLTGVSVTGTYGNELVRLGGYSDPSGISLSGVTIGNGASSANFGLVLDNLDGTLDLADTVFGSGTYTGVTGKNAAISVSSDAIDAAIDTSAITFPVGLNAIFNGTAGPDTINGTPFADGIFGAGGDDVLNGLAGDDMILGEAGADIIDGGDGFDMIDGGTEDDTIAGGAGNDVIGGGDGDDTIEGGAGADVIDGGANTVAGDTASYENSGAAVTVDLEGGIAVGGDAAGDTLVDIENVLGSGFSDILGGEEGVDNVLDGGAGAEKDTVTYASAGAGVFVDLDADIALDGGAGTDTLLNIENVIGSDFDDNIFGDAGMNDLAGGAGDDVISGLGGMDSLSGGAGFDTLVGGGGEDTLNGGADGDLLFGGLGDDSLSGGDGDDTLAGEAGDDTVNGDAGDDLLLGGAGADSMDGGAGTDTIDYSGSTAAVQVDLSTNSFSGGDATGDSGVNVENLIGTTFDDQLTGTAGANVIDGLDGADTIMGLGGDDTLNGGLGADLIDGGTGDDTISGGGQADTLIGGGGADAISGGGGADEIIVPDTNFASVDGNGSSGDRLTFDVTNTPIDATSFAAKTTNVEEIDITGTGDNSLSLSESEVTAITGGGNVLKVFRDLGDDVILEGGWTFNGIVSMGGTDFLDFTRGAAQALVQNVGAWSLTGGTNSALVNEGDSATYTLDFTGTIPAGKSVSIDLGFTGVGANPASEGDLTGGSFLAQIAAQLPPAGWTLAGNTLTIDSSAAQPPSISFNIDILADGVIEAPLEDYVFTIGNPSDGFLDPSVSVVQTSIVDDFAAGVEWFVETPTGTVHEGGDAVFEIGFTGQAAPLGQPATITVTPDFAGAFTADEATDITGTVFDAIAAAIAALPPGAGISFDAGTGELTFAGSASSLTFGVPLALDGTVEGLETFAIDISSPTAGNLDPVNASATHGILDASAIEFEIVGNNPIGGVDEGDPGDFTLGYNGGPIPAGETAFVDVTLTGVLPPAEVDPADFGAATLSQALLDALTAAAPAGVTVAASPLGGGAIRVTFDSSLDGAPASFNFQLDTIDDAIFEDTEFGNVELTATSHALGANTLAFMDIVDNDFGFVWSIAGDTSVEEGNAAAYTISYTGPDLDMAAGNTVSIDVLTTINDAGQAADADFVPAATALEDALTTAAAATAGVTFDPGTFTLTFDGTTNALDFTLLTDLDGVGEGIESFDITLDNPQADTGGGNFPLGAVDGASGSVTTEITEPPVPLTWELTGDATVAEGDIASYDLTVAGGPLPAGQTASIDIGIVFAGANPASAADFQNAFLADLDAAIGGTSIVRAGNTLIFDESSPAALTIDLPTLGDLDTNEGSETYRLELSNPSVNTSVAGTGFVSTAILDDFAATFEWSATTATPEVLEGGSAEIEIGFTGGTIPAGDTASVEVLINLPGAPGGAEAADFVNGFAADLSAAAAAAGVTVNMLGAGHFELVFDALSDTSVSISQETLAGDGVEGPELFDVFIQNPSGGSLAAGNDVATVVIKDAEPVEWTLVADSATVTEGGIVTYTLSYTGGPVTPGQPLEVDLALTNIDTDTNDFLQLFADALAGAATVDVGVSGATVSFNNPAVTSFQFAVPTRDDVLFEGDEDYQVEIASVSNGSVVTGVAGTTIEDNESVAWQITGPAAITEGDTGTVAIGYTGATADPGAALSIDITIDGASTADDADLLDNTGDPNLLEALEAAAAATAGAVTVTDVGGGIYRLTFTDPSVTSLSVDVTALDDGSGEGNEDLVLAIDNPQVNGNAGGTLAAGLDTATTTIIEPRAAVDWELTGDAVVTEGDAAGYTLTLSGGPLLAGQTASVDVALNFPAIPNAAEAPDFTNGLAADLLAAAAMTPGVTVSGTTITFDDTATVFSFDLATLQDGLAEAPPEIYRLSLDNIEAGDTVTGTGFVSTAIQDDFAENLEWFATADTAEVYEGGAIEISLGFTGATVPVGETVSIDVLTNLGGAGALSDADFASGSFIAALDAALVGTGVVRAGSTLIWDSGADTAVTLSLPTEVDGVPEGTELFDLILDNPSDGTIAAGRDVASVVVRDAAALEWTLTGDANIDEGNSASYTISYTGGPVTPGQGVSFDMAVVHNLTEDADFSAIMTLQDAFEAALAAAAGPGVTVSGTTVTLDGVTSFSFALGTLDDNLFEVAEDFEVALTGVSTGTILGGGLVNTTIADNDDGFVFAIDGGGTISEGDAASYTVSYTGLDIEAGNTVTVDLASDLGGIGKANDADFTSPAFNAIQAQAALVAGVTFDAVTGTFTFDGTVTSFSFDLTTVDADGAEGTEDFTLTLENPSAGIVAAGQENATTVIEEPRPAVTWTLTGDAGVTEGDSAAYTVDMTGGPLLPGQTASIDIGLQLPMVANAAELADFTNGFLADVQAAADATAGVTLSGNTLTFDDSVTSFAFDLSVLQDGLSESPELYRVQLSNAEAGDTVASPAFVSTLISDDFAEALEWFVQGETTAVFEGGALEFTIGFDNATIPPGETATIDILSTFGAAPGQLSVGDLTDTFANLLDASLVGTGVTRAGTTLIFDSASDTQVTFSLPTGTDGVPEGIELVDIAIQNPSEGTIAAGQDIVTLTVEDSVALEWTIAGDAKVDEGNAATYTVEYTGGPVTPGQGVSFDLAINLISAEDGDFDAMATATEALEAALSAAAGAGVTVSGTTVTLDGVTSFSFDLATLLDGVFEGPEDFEIEMTGVSTGSIVGAPTVATEIVDADASGEWSVTGDANVTEGDTAGYTISYDGGAIEPGGTVSVVVGSDLGDPGKADNFDFTQALFTAINAQALLTAGVTFDVGTGTLTFDDTVTSLAFDLVTVDMDGAEGNEDFTITLDTPSAGTTVSMAEGAATTVIEEPRPNVTWTLTGDAGVTEGQSAAYSLALGGGPLLPGQTASIDIDMILPDPMAVANPAELADFTNGFLADLQTAVDATAGVTLSGNTLTFDDTATVLNFDIETALDALDETPPEIFRVALSNAEAGDTVAGTGVVTTAITDDFAQDLEWFLNTGTNSVFEGGTLSFTVGYTGATLPLGETISIDLMPNFGAAAGQLSEADLTDTFLNLVDAALAGTGITRAGMTLEFDGASDTQVTIDLPTFADGLNAEGNEIADVAIANPSDGVIQAGASDTILQVQDAVALDWSIAGDASVDEGDAATFTVAYTGGPVTPGQGVSVTLDAALGTAEDADFAAMQTLLEVLEQALADAAAGDPGLTASGLTVTMDGVTSFSFTVPTLDDPEFEGVEDFTVSIDSVSTGAVSTPAATTDILDNDGTFEFAIEGATTIAEGDSGSYTISLTGPAIQAGSSVSVTVVQTGTAADADFTQAVFTALGTAAAAANIGFDAGTGVLTFDETSDTSFSFDLSAVDMDGTEGNEELVLTLDSPSAGALAAGMEAVTTEITEPVPPLMWSIDGDTGVMEGQDAAYTVSFTGGPLGPGQSASIELDLVFPMLPNAAELPDFDFATTFGDHITAIAAGATGVSYDPGTGVLTLDDTAGGSFAFTLPVELDVFPDNGEVYELVLSNPSDGGTIAAGGDVQTTIITEDFLANVEWFIDSPQNFFEGQTATFTVGFDGVTQIPAGQTVSIRLDDNLAIPPGGAGEASTDDIDPAGFLALVDAAAMAATGVSFDVGTQRLTFDETATSFSLQVDIPTVSDAIAEVAEAFNIFIDTPQVDGSADGTIAGDPFTTIIINEPQPVVWVIGADDGTVAEGGTEAVTVGYTGGPLMAPATIDLALLLGSASDADLTDGATALEQALADAVAANPGSMISVSGTTLTFDPAGASGLTFDIGAVADALLEPAEDLSITISGPSEGTVSPTADTADIEITDVPPQVDWTLTGDTTVSEGGTASYTLGYTGVTLSGAQTVSITVEQLLGTASAADFPANEFFNSLDDAISGTGITRSGNVLTFHAGDPTSIGIGIDIATDEIVDDGETYTMEISDPLVNGGASGNIVSGSIETVIDDVPPQASWEIAGSASLNEGAMQTGVYTVSYTGITLQGGETVSVRIDTDVDAVVPPGSASDADFTQAFLDRVQAAADATAGVSFDQASQRLTFDAANVGRNLTFTWQVADDALTEGNETFNISLSQPQKDGSADGIIDPVNGSAETIINDDELPVLIDWTLTGDTVAIEGGQAQYEIGYTGTFQPGQQAAIDLTLDFGTASAADFPLDLVAALQSAINALPLADRPILSFDPGNLFAATLTFTDSSVSNLQIMLPIADDGTGEGVEDYTMRIDNPTGGTVPGGAVEVDTDIFENGPLNLEWEINGDLLVNEGQTASYTVSIGGDSLLPGQVVFIDIGIDLPGAGGSVADGGANADDFVQAFLASVQNAVDATTGAELNGNRLQFDHTFAGDLTIDLETFNDTAVEGFEVYTVFLDNPSVGDFRDDVPDRDFSLVGTTIVDDDTNLAVVNQSSFASLWDDGGLGASADLAMITVEEGVSYAVTQAGDAGDNVFAGGTALDVMAGGGGNDTLLGQGGADIIDGGSGDDLIGMLDAGFGYVFGGAGEDTLAIGGGGVDLDVTALRDGGRLHDVEIFDLTGSGDNSISLNALDVLDLAPETGMVTIAGDAGDSVNADLSGAGYADLGSMDGFLVYSNGSETLRIDEDISQNNVVL